MPRAQETGCLTGRTQRLGGKIAFIVWGCGGAEQSKEDVTFSPIGKLLSVLTNICSLNPEWIAKFDPQRLL